MFIPPIFNILSQKITNIDAPQSMLLELEPNSVELLEDDEQLPGTQL